MVRDGGRSSLPSALLQATLVERTLRTERSACSRWQEKLLAKRFTPSRAGGANLAHEDSYRNLLARECFYPDLFIYQRP